LLLLEGFVRRRIAAAAVLAVGLVFGTAGCTFFSPQATLIHYDASDGVSLNVGHLEVRNALVISPKGTDGALVGVFINTSTKSLPVEIEYTSHSTGKATTDVVEVDLAAGQVLSFGNPGVAQLVFRALNVPPGALARLYIEPVGASGKYLSVPVLINSDGDYNGDAPSPTPSPTATLSPIPTKSPKP
jgi:hypothetical protein